MNYEVSSQWRSQEKIIGRAAKKMITYKLNTKNILYITIEVLLSTKLTFEMK
jgi:hypothetical protein